ncbi:conserved hypothetical protein [Hahella chejuensis KCTC 2396]|uniref:Uncharacterized protein n=2 Tax=Hahella chejuensis TaxID=158327 RepID=Q2S7A9_HAHCH|nr:conserved hypothetical protein [Hahella chejuensis KCTC 2396]
MVALAALVVAGYVFFASPGALKTASPPISGGAMTPPVRQPMTKPAVIPVKRIPAEKDVIAMVEEEQQEVYPELPTDIEALASFSVSIDNGDRRAPPIGRRALEQTPDAETLADHEAYARREAQQHQRVLNAFRAAAQDKAAELERLIAEGRARGVAPQLLQEAEAKRDALWEAIHMINQE